MLHLFQIFLDLVCWFHHFDVWVGELVFFFSNFCVACQQSLFWVNARERNSKINNFFSHNTKISKVYISFQTAGLFFSWAKGSVSSTPVNNHNTCSSLGGGQASVHNGVLFAREARMDWNQSHCAGRGSAHVLWPLCHRHFPNLSKLRPLERPAFCIQAHACLSFLVWPHHCSWYPPSLQKIPSFIPLPCLWSLFSHGLLYVTSALFVPSALERQWLWSRNEERRSDLHNSERLHIDLLRCFLLLDCIYRYGTPKAIIHMFREGKGHKEDNNIKTRLKKHIWREGR